MPRKKDAIEEIASVIEKLRCGLYLLASSDGKRSSCCPVAWVSRASFRPPLMAVFLHPKRYTYEIILNSKSFSLAILGRKGIELARKMGSVSGREVDKLSQVKWRKGVTGAPIIEDGSVGYIDCKLEASFPAGDHVCLLGKVIEAKISSKEKPILYDPKDFYPL